MNTCAERERVKKKWWVRRGGARLNEKATKRAGHYVYPSCQSYARQTVHTIALTDDLQGEDPQPFWIDQDIKHISLNLQHLFYSHSTQSVV